MLACTKRLSSTRRFWVLRSKLSTLTLLNSIMCEGLSARCFPTSVIFITNTPMNNGYTHKFIKNIIHSSLTKYFSDNNYRKEGPERLKLCFYLPYIGDASFKVRKRRMLESHFIQDSMFNHKLLNDYMKSVPLYLFNLPYR